MEEILLFISFISEIRLQTIVVKDSQQYRRYTVPRQSNVRCIQLNNSHIQVGWSCA
jgi:hypothetical protein